MKRTGMMFLRRIFFSLHCSIRSLVGIDRFKSNRKKHSIIPIIHHRNSTKIIRLLIVQNLWKRTNDFSLFREENSHPVLFSSLHRFPSQASLEFLAIPTPTVGSLRSTPSLVSLDKLSIASNHSSNPRQKSNQLKDKKVNQILFSFDRSQSALFYQ